MSLAIVNSRAGAGISAPAVTIEVHLSRGLPGLSMVGLPEKAVKESKDRVRSALLNSGFEFPTKRVTVNLAPADLPKEGGRFDLPIALGILAATAQIPVESLKDYEFAGELALSGVLRPIRGVLPFAIATRQQRRKLLVPQDNLAEALLSGNTEIYSTDHITNVCAHLKGLNLLNKHDYKKLNLSSIEYFDISDVIGQIRGKRALEIAAAGGHSILFSGPPGTGKTMLASRLPGILPPMSEETALEVAALYSVSTQGFHVEKWGVRPFRSPHHTASSVALVGGSNPPKPGEISLAHHGVLFLDELPEFNRHVLEALREPLEAGKVTISRASHQAQFPANFQFIAAMNPCPCGYYGSPDANCRCTEDQIKRYQSRLSGPLLDRIDIHVEITPLPKGLLMQKKTQNAATSKIIRERVSIVREQQLCRQAKPNAQLIGEEIKRHCQLNKMDEEFLEKALESLGLSTRAFHRVLRVARTIADLEQSEDIQTQHLQESLSYRNKVNLHWHY